LLLHCNPAFTPYFYNENVARKMYDILWCKTNTNFQERLKIKYKILKNSDFCDIETLRVVQRGCYILCRNFHVASSEAKKTTKVVV